MIINKGSKVDRQITIELSINEIRLVKEVLDLIENALMRDENRNTCIKDFKDDKFNRIVFVGKKADTIHL